MTKVFYFVFQFPDETLRSGELLNMIVAVIDSTQVRLSGPIKVSLQLWVEAFCVTCPVTRMSPVCAVTGADVPCYDG